MGGRLKDFKVPSEVTASRWRVCRAWPLLPCQGLSILPPQEAWPISIALKAHLEANMKLGKGVVRILEDPSGQPLSPIPGRAPHLALSSRRIFSH